jgi:putative ABC transport system substrate-binding protein
MRRIGLAVVLALSLAPLAIEAQQAGKVWRIGILSMAPTAETPVFDAFRKALQELGYVEGKSIVLNFRLSHGSVDRLGPLASELVGSGVDVIVADGGNAVRAAFDATKEIPIVIGTGSSDPVAQGFAKSLARPGGNVTGATTVDREVVGKQLEVLKEALPTLSRVAVLHNPRTSRSQLEAARVAANSLGLKLSLVEAQSPDALLVAFQSVERARPGGRLGVSRPDALRRENTDRRIGGQASPSPDG